MCIGYMQIVRYFIKGILVSVGVLEPITSGYEGWLYIYICLKFSTAKEKLLKMMLYMCTY